MSGSRRFLLLLLIACISCVLLVQVSLDGWKLETSFSYAMNAEPKDLNALQTKQDRKAVNVSSTQNENNLPKVNLTIKSYKKPLKNIAHISENIVQVRRVPLAKVVPKMEKDQVLVSRQERLQEILKTGSAIHNRPSIDSMRSLKPLPIVDPKNVTRIIVLTYFRAGSSFLGDLLQQNWKTFYHFEPLHSMTYNSRIGAHKLDEAFHLFNSILNCNFTEAMGYLNWVKRPQNKFLFGHNLFLRVTCHNNPKTCFNTTFLNAVCVRAPVHVMKIGRLHMHDLKTYLEENSDMNIKVVYLTRDPRGILSSRWSLDWCNGTECTDANVLCSEMHDDLKVFKELQTENPYNFIKIRYEDLSLNPDSESRRLFKFLGLPFTAAVERFLKTHTVGKRNDDRNPYSTRRNTTAMAFTWRERYTYNQVIDDQDSCKTVLKSLNHSLITSPDQLPYPNGKAKANQSTSEQINKNPLFLKSQLMNKTVSSQIDFDINLKPYNPALKFLNNTSIEIHKTFNISNNSIKSNPRTIDYILVKQLAKR